MNADFQLVSQIDSPREAAIAIVHLINSRNQNVALLALAVRPFIPGGLNAFGRHAVRASCTGPAQTNVT